jgi:hypothetical protein
MHFSLIPKGLITGQTSTGHFAASDTEALPLATWWRWALHPTAVDGFAGQWPECR